MPKKLNIDSLSSEIATLKELHVSAINSNDIVGKMQLEHRLKKLTEKIEELEGGSLGDNSANQKIAPEPLVAIFTGSLSNGFTLEHICEKTDVEDCVEKILSTSKGCNDDVINLVEIKPPRHGARADRRGRVLALFTGECSYMQISAYGPFASFATSEDFVRANKDPFETAFSVSIGRQ